MLPTITIDIGTTRVKLCLFDAEGTVLRSIASDTPVVGDAWGLVYDMDALIDLIHRFVDGLDASLRAVVRRISIAGVGESGGLVRGDLSLASPMVLWHDHRGADWLRGLSAADHERIYRITGLPVNANYGISKVAWALTRLDEGEVSGDAQWLNVSEYLAALLTGERRSEYSLASRTMALDVRAREWSVDVCAMFGVPVGVFPPLQAATAGQAILGGVARRLELDESVRVHVAGHDHMVGAIGAESHPGELLNSTGTTEGLLFLRDAPDLGDRASEARLANGIDPTGSRFSVFASIPTGGSAFGTLQTLLGLEAEALRWRIAEIGSNWRAGRIDLRRVPLVLPQFRGAPPPTKDASVRGVISRIGTDTTIDELIFGSFLGQVLQFRDVLALFTETPSIVKVIGPGSRDPLWLQLKADILGLPLAVSTFPEVVSLGAQVLASGAGPGWDACEPRMVSPDLGRTALLRDWSESVREHWSMLKELPS